MNQFTSQELQTIFILLGRVQITGQEAEKVFALQHKISQILQSEIIDKEKS